LPVEIVAMIERRLIQKSIQRAVTSHLEKARNCGELICQPTSHITALERASVLAEAMDDDTCSVDWENEEELEKNEEKYLNNWQAQTGEGLDYHFQRADLWEHITKRELTCSSTDCLCFSAKYDKVGFEYQSIKAKS